MKRIIIIISLLILLAVSSFAGWTTTYGGDDNDRCYYIIQTADNGYAIVGMTESFSEMGSNVFLAKFNSSGDTVWRRDYGGPVDDEEAYCIKQTSDGGYIAAGYTYGFGLFAPHVYLLKVDANGDSMWMRTYGGRYNDGARSVSQTCDGGYIVAGWTQSYGAMGYDVFLMKTNSMGDSTWIRTFGGTNNEFAYTVEQTLDSGFILIGYTESFGADAEDVYLIKTDRDGNEEWSRTYGGSSNERGRCGLQTSDSGYVIVGYTESFGAGLHDAYVIKADPLGNVEWSQTYGTWDHNFGYSIDQTHDGGYIFSGYTLTSATRWYDLYLVKTDALGNQEWSQIFGENGEEYGYSVIETADRGYAIGGWKKAFDLTHDDLYIIKTDSLGRLGDYNYLAILVNSTHEQRHYNVLSKAYASCILRGFKDNQIYILHYEDSVDVDSWGGNDVDAIATPNNLEYAIQNWAVSRADSGTKLYLVFTDHGNVDWYPMAGPTDSSGITPWGLDLYLNNFMNATHAESIFIVINACHSGSFISHLSGSSRVLITSTNATTNTIYAPGFPYFGYDIWTYLKLGYDFADAFDHVSELIDALIFDQSPMLDDNGDTLGHPYPLPNGGDGVCAGHIRWGTSSSGRKGDVVLDSVAIAQFTIDTASSDDSVFFHVRTSTYVETCWVFAVRTDTTYEAPEGQEIVLDLPFVKLAHGVGLNYRGGLRKSRLKGTYKFVALAQAPVAEGMPVGVLSRPLRPEFEYHSYVKDLRTLPEEMYHISVQPNPFNSQCYISTPEAADVLIFNLQGERVAELDGGTDIWVPGSMLESGVYIIQVIDGGRIVATRKAVRIDY